MTLNVEHIRLWICDYFRISSLPLAPLISGEWSTWEFVNASNFMCRLKSAAQQKWFSLIFLCGRKIENDCNVCLCKEEQLDNLCGVIIWLLYGLCWLWLPWTWFGMVAEWHHFATSHGKGLCNGVGVTIKHLATRASLQRSYDNQFYDTTSVDFFTKAQYTSKNQLCWATLMEQVYVKEWSNSHNSRIERVLQSESESVDVLQSVMLILTIKPWNFQT